MQSWERAPEWVREAVDRCLHDVQQLTVIDVALDWVVDALFPDPEGGGGGGVSFTHTQPNTGQRLSLIGAYEHPVDRRTRRELRRR